MNIPIRYDQIKLTKGQHVILTKQKLESKEEERAGAFYYIADHKDGQKILLGTNTFPPFAFQVWPIDMVPKWAENMSYKTIEKNKLTTCWWMDKKEFYALRLEQKQEGEK